MDNIIKCILCNIKYIPSELNLINGDVAECPNGHAIDLITLQTYDYTKYIDTVNSMGVKQ